MKINEVWHYVLRLSVVILSDKLAKKSSFTGNAQNVSTLRKYKIIYRLDIKILSR